MKSKQSPQYYGDSDYNLIPLREFPYITIRAASLRLGVSQQRTTRLLKILQVPIIKVGTLVLLPPMAVEVVEHAIETNQVKRGRKPNAA